MQNSTNGNSQRPPIDLDDLHDSLKLTRDHLKKLNKNFVNLKRVNDSLVDFNDAFGAFLFGMAANDSTVEWNDVINN